MRRQLLTIGFVFGFFDSLTDTAQSDDGTAGIWRAMFSVISQPGRAALWVCIRQHSIAISCFEGYSAPWVEDTEEN